MNQWSDIDDTYTPGIYKKDVVVNQRSRSQGQRSRSYMRFCKKIVLTIYHEPRLNINDPYTNDYY